MGGDEWQVSDSLEREIGGVVGDPVLGGFELSPCHLVKLRVRHDGWMGTKSTVFSVRQLN